MSESASLTVIVVSAGGFAQVRRTVRHLQRQTVAREIQLLIVVRDAAMAADHQPAELTGFAESRFVFAGQPITNVDHAAALAVPCATSPVTAIIEDHAYPEPEWAEWILTAHQEHWVAVGSTMVNANPGPWSWVNLLIAYGPWTEGGEAGPQTALPGHNLAYKTAVLQDYGDSLWTKLGRGGGLLEELGARGGRFYLESRARLAHANPSLLKPTWRLRFCAGRLYAFERARREHWGVGKRLVYTGLGLAIPFLRLVRLNGALLSRPALQGLRPGIWPALWTGLLFDALGQMAGYCAGVGEAREILAVFEMDRRQHLKPKDQQLLADSSA